MGAGWRQLAGMAWPEVAELADRVRGGAVLAVPVGSTEQHGPHLPLSTDTDLAVALCDRLAAARPQVLAAPPVCYGSSGEHQGFPGTLSVGRDVLEALLVELCRSATCTFDAVVLVSTHGGNADPVAAAGRRLAGEGRDVLVWTARWRGDAHAGRTETSIQLALHPSAVRLDRAAPGDRRPVAELLPAMQAGGVRSVSPNGVLGDPTGASADDGAAVVADLVADLLAAVDRWRPGLDRVDARGDGTPASDGGASDGGVAALDGAP